MERVEFAADLETPVSAFLKLSPLNPVFLLESVERNETIGRYSFLGIGARKYLVLNQSEDFANFFADIGRTLSQITSGEAVRLSSGLVGFFSYHLASLLQPKISIKQSSFPVAGFVSPAAILVFDHLKRRILFSSDLPDSEQHSLIREIRRCLRGSLRVPRSGKSSAPRANLSEPEFSRMVNKARDYIAAGEIFQVVLSMQFEGETDVDPFQMYRALRMINPSPYMFYLNFRDEFRFFGSSPETLVRTENDRIILRPIAGTMPRSLDPVEDGELEKRLLSDEKEKAEHLMLLDLARNDLGRVSQTGSIKVSELMKVERYSHVMHLVSTVEGRVERRPSILELFRAVFPAGTVSGAPKVRAMQIIHELEPHSRDLYAGSLGYFSSQGEIDHCISIRCFQAVGNKYRYTAGAGIVADSVPEREYQEIMNKSMALQTMLKMAKEPL